MSKIQELEMKFLMTYPMGFEDEEMIEVGKKHKMDKITTFAQDHFTKAAFKNERILLDDLLKLVNMSTLVSRFEKPAFKKFMMSLSLEEKERLTLAIYELIHGDEANGFEHLVQILLPYKLAKWPLVTVVKTYFDPNYEVFMKPTTVKMILKHFEVKDLKYNSRPSFDFYDEYRTFINELKKEVTPLVAPNNPAFSGFLMMTIED